jgi:hypothetical protein
MNQLLMDFVAFTARGVFRGAAGALRLFYEARDLAPSWSLPIALGVLVFVVAWIRLPVAANER